MKVIGILNNYKGSGISSHSEPVPFLMADSSLLKGGNPFFIPDFDNRFVAYPSLIIKICKLGKNVSAKFASRYYDEMAIGLNIRSISTFENIVAESLPWSWAAAFDGSAVIGEFVKAQPDDIAKASIEIKKNNQIVSVWNAVEMLQNIDAMIEKFSSRFTLKIGDIFYVALHPEGFDLAVNDSIEGFLDGNKMLAFNIK